MLQHQGIRAAIYKRVSTTKSSQRDSPEHQEGICREKAKQLNLTVLEECVYEDRDTGTNIVGRPAIRQLIVDAQARQMDAIIFASLSRFSRDTMDSLALKRTLVDSLGIRLISLDEGYDSQIDRDELKFQIISAVNQKLSEQISLSSKRGIRQSALNGNFTGSAPPFGYQKQLNGSRKTLVPHEETRQVVHLIYQLYTADKLGEKRIVNYLNERKIRSPKGGLWGITTVQRILQNEVYIGVNVFCKYEVKQVYNNIQDLSDRKKVLIQRAKATWERSHEPQTHEPIIDREVFQLAQEIRLLRSGGTRGGVRNKVNLFAGWITCLHCGSAMVSMKSGGGSSAETYRYLVCSKRRRQGPVGCSNAYGLPYEPFKADVLDEISEIIGNASCSDELLLKFKAVLKQASAAWEKQQKQDEKQMERYRKMLFDLRSDKIQSAITEQQYAYEKRQIELELEQLEYRLEEASQKAADIPDLTDLNREVLDALDDLLDLNYDEAEFDELRLILGKLIAAITVDWQGNVEVRMMFEDNQS